MKYAVIVSLLMASRTFAADDAPVLLLPVYPTSFQPSGGSVEPAAAEAPPDPNFAAANLRWDNGRWLSADGRYWAPPRGAWQERQWQTIPAQGHYVTRRVCGAGGCRNVRVWVQTAPASRVEVNATSAPNRYKPLQTPTNPHKPLRLPNYPNQPLGRYWRYNGGPITAAHLSGGHHSHERFDPHWLNSLSFQEIQALGSDSHNGHTRLREQYIVRR
jgi:hypothetical protein